LYKLRHLVENAFARLKHYRAVPPDMTSLLEIMRASCHWLAHFSGCRCELSTAPRDTGDCRRRGIRRSGDCGRV